MIPRTLEPEVMDTPEEAADYDAMDHAAVNRRFCEDFLNVWHGEWPILDVGTGTAQIPVLLARATPPAARIVAIDLAGEMLALARRNVDRAGLADRVELRRVNGREMPFPAGTFPAVISNSIIHHIPEPIDCLREMVRVARRVAHPGATFFVRDLMRPGSDAEVERLVQAHAAGANSHQQQLFRQSLHAALTLAEARDLVASLGFPAETVQATSDRHWTWATSSRISWGEG